MTAKPIATAAWNGAVLDTTILRFAKDLRGIHQVVFRMAEVLATDSRFAGTRFVAAEGTFEKYLEQLGIARERVVEMPPAPVVGRFERFHGIASTWRYRHLIAERPKLLIHPELRTVVRGDVPQALCYHDFIELDEAPSGPRKPDRLLYYKYKSRIAAGVAYKMTNSDHTRLRALELFTAMDPASIRTVHLGVRKSLETALTGRSPDFNPLVCLYVGSFETRKNIPELIRRFREVVGDRNAVLHLAGHISPDLRAQLQSLARESGVASQIQWHGVVSEEQLRALYASSHALLFPSLKEGFGLPLAEAMAYGLVVFAFRNSCIPEVLADAGILAEDNDFTAWGREVDAMIREPGRFQRLVALARARARYYSADAAQERLGAWFEGIFRKAGIQIPGVDS